MTEVVEAPHRSHQLTGRVASVLLVLAGAGFVLIHASAGDQGGPEGWLQHLTFGLPLMAAGVVALVGSLERVPWLMVVGGAAAVPICLVSFVGVPALLPAGVVIAVGASGLRAVSTRDVLAAVVLVTLLVGGFGYEVLHQDPAQWATPDGSAGSSNVVTTAESLVVLVAVALALMVAGMYVRANRRS
jgi:hypothetical protein